MQRCMAYTHGMLLSASAALYPASHSGTVATPGVATPGGGIVVGQDGAALCRLAFVLCKDKVGLDHRSLVRFAAIAASIEVTCRPSA